MFSVSSVTVAPSSAAFLCGGANQRVRLQVTSNSGVDLHLGGSESEAAALLRNFSGTIELDIGGPFGLWVYNTNVSLARTILIQQAGLVAPAAYSVVYE